MVFFPARKLTLLFCSNYPFKLEVVLIMQILLIFPETVIAQNFTTKIFVLTNAGILS